MQPYAAFTHGRNGKCIIGITSDCNSGIINSVHESKYVCVHRSAPVQALSSGLPRSERFQPACPRWHTRPIWVTGKAGLLWQCTETDHDKMGRTKNRKWPSTNEDDKGIGQKKNCESSPGEGMPQVSRTTQSELCTPCPHCKAARLLKASAKRSSSLPI